MNEKLAKRDTNIELLRIISILLIICFHYVYKSGYMNSYLNIHTFFIKSMWFLGELGVNLFILITGYHLCKAKSSAKKLILFCLEVFFYNFLLYGLDILFGNNQVDTLKEKILLFFPLITQKYWFATAYILVYILSPFYNMLINSFTKRIYQKFLLTNILLWSLIPTMFGIFYNTSESVLYYNRFIWLTLMYFVGAYIKIFDIKFFASQKRSLFTFIITYLTMLFSIILIYHLRKHLVPLGTSEIAYFWTPNNILMLILSISMFKLFTNLKIKNDIFINKVASTTLGIYLLHDGSFTNYMWKNIFRTNFHIYKPTFWIHMVVATIYIFLVGVLIDFIRQTLEKYTIKKIINLKIWNNLYINIKEKLLKITDKWI